MNINRSMLFTFIFTCSVISHAQELIEVEPDIADRFDYPFGDRGYKNNGEVRAIDEHIYDECLSVDNPEICSNYNRDRNEQYNRLINVHYKNERCGSSDACNGSNITGENTWYNVNDVGAFGGLPVQRGLHPGEDWNLIDDADVGHAVYAVANGRVVDVSVVETTAASRGWKIVIRHTLPDGSYIYSIYLHLTYSDNVDGTVNAAGHISPVINRFAFQKGDNLNRGSVIGRVAANMSSGLDSHLHFEIRTLYDDQSDERRDSPLYWSANGQGYYTHDGEMHDSMDSEDVINAFYLMKREGILDASDFIDDHRKIYNASGTASLVSYHAQTRPLTINDDQYPIGITSDYVATSNLYNFQSGFFQWQASDDCKRVKISHSESNVNANITVGGWSNNRASDRFFSNVDLPVIIGANNLLLTDGLGFDGNDWYVLSVNINPDVASGLNHPAGSLRAECSTNSETVFLGNPLPAPAIMLGKHQWQGSGSVISRIFSAYEDQNFSGIDSWPYGVFSGVIRVFRSPYPPVIFFQWMGSSTCSSLMINSNDIDNESTQVSVGTKQWNSNTYKWRDGSLPYVVENTSGIWTVVQIKFVEPFNQSDVFVRAECVQ